jgi:predicted ATP-dependent endonuclease of OLD family
VFKISETNELSSKDEEADTKEDIAILVEGRTDQFIISTLAERILKMNNLQKKIRVFNSGGKYSMARHANAIEAFSEGKRKYILVVDSDEDKEETRSLILKNLEIKDATIVIPDPEIENWFKQSGVTDRNTFRAYSLAKNESAKNAVESLLDEIDIKLLAMKDDAFNAFYEAIINS